ncbi:MAG: hypothetical protein JXX14_14080 [Deltaproteobacteria bacterium]|nr:hypothetical protein [Deltaproteobacteria bacterium]
MSRSTAQQSFEKEALHPKKIAIWDTDELFLKNAKVQLNALGFQHVSTCLGMCSETQHMSIAPYSLIAMNLAVFEDRDDCFTFTEFTRFMGFPGRIVILTERATLADICEAAESGADDVWVKGENLNFCDEVMSLLSRTSNPLCDADNSAALRQLGLFRSLGLTSREADLLLRTAPSASNHPLPVPKAINVTAPAVNTLFTIREKAAHLLGLDSPQSLSGLATVCSGFLGNNFCNSPLQTDSIEAFFPSPISPCIPN